MRPELAETIPCAYVVSDDGDGTVVVRPADTKRKRRVSGEFVFAVCIDGASSLAFRGQGGGTAGRAVSRARSAEAKTNAKAQLTPAQQEDAYEMHGLGCTCHSVNLKTDDSHRHTEAKIMVENMVRDRAARVLQRFFLSTLNL